MDVAFVRRLAGDLDDGTIVLVGPESDPDPALLALAARRSRARRCRYADLPALAAAAAVLIMPYADLPVTRAMQPLKLKEYLATGKPVVVRDLPADPAVGRLPGPGRHGRGVLRPVRSGSTVGVDAAQRDAPRRLAAESWDEKARRSNNGSCSRSPLKSICSPPRRAACNNDR